MRAAGITFDPAGKREADRRIRVNLGMAGAGCPEIWSHLKTLSPGDVLDLLRKPVEA